MNDDTINAIGPLQERMDHDPNVWNEIEHYGEYYYFRIGFHHYVSAEPAPRPGYTWYPIGRDNYMVVDEITIAEFSNTPLCHIATQIMLECTSTDDMGDFTQENPVYVKDILMLLLKNHDTLITVFSTISQKTHSFIEAGKLDKLRAAMNVKKVKTRIGMNMDIFTELFEMTHPQSWVIGPISVRLSPTKYWDAIESVDGGSFYYFRKGYYARVFDPSSHWIKSLPHHSVYIGETQYIVINNDKFDSKGDCAVSISEATRSEATIPKEEATIPKEEATIPKEEATSKKEEATSKKEEATSKKEEATSKKEEATNKKEEATSKKEEATNKKEEATSKKEEATIPSIVVPPNKVPNKVASNLEDVSHKEQIPKQSWCCIC
jgi:hypothetical protein